MNKDFIVKDDILIKYNGKNKIVTIPEGIKIINKECFAENRSIEEIHLPESLKTIRNDAFFQCTNLKKINLDKIENISSFAFANCKKLEEINLRNVKNIKEIAFSDCNIKRINLPENVKNIDNLFLNRCKIEEIEINSETLYVTNWIDKYNDINKVILNNKENDVYMFLFMSLMKAKIIESNNPNYIVKDGILYNKEQTELVWCPPMLDIEKYKIPNTVEEIGRYSFIYNQNLKEIELGNNAKLIGEYAFANSKIENVKLNNKLETITMNAFSNCNMLKNINLDNVIIIRNNAFNNAYNLEKIKLNKVEIIESYAFAKTGIKNITLPKSLMYLSESMLINCTKLKTATINCNMDTKIQSLFLSCSNLEKIVINNTSDFDLSTYGFGLKLKEIEINNPLYKIKDGMIYSADETKLIYCPPMLDIEKYKIPNTINKINEFAFINNENIKEIELGENVKMISKYAFNNSRIENIKFNNQLETIGLDALSGTMCKEIDLSKTNIKSLNLKNIGLDSNKNITQKVIIPDKIESLNTIGAKTKIYGNLLKKNYPIEIQKIEEINFKKSLEELIESGKSFREASNIIKMQER